jgi:chloramphenicol 3-O phosphotransferase
VTIGEPTIVLITGASSTGKTTVARELQRVLAKPAVYLPGDAFDVPRPARWAEGLCFADLAALQDRMDEAYVNALAVFPRFGLHSIGEVVFRQRERHDRMVAAIGDVRLLVIRLTASPHTVERREAERGDRPHGTARAQQRAEFIPPELALEIDTDSYRPTDVASAIAAIVG